MTCLKFLGVIVLLLIEKSCFSQKQLIIQKNTNGKEIVLDEGDRARIYFRSDTVPALRYRPLLYRKKDQHYAYARGEITEFTENGIKFRPTRRLINRIFNHPVDTLTIGIDQITAMNKYHPAVMTGAFVLSAGVVQAGTVLVVIQTGAFIPIAGAILAGFIARPITSKYVQNMGIPPRKVKKPQWKLYFEDDKQAKK